MHYYNWTEFKSRVLVEEDWCYRWPHNYGGVCVGKGRVIQGRCSLYTRKKYRLSESVPVPEHKLNNL